MKSSVLREPLVRPQGPPTAVHPRGILAKRLVIVTGKGGVGKSTVAAALGVAAARQGLRAVVAEVAGQWSVAQMLDGRPAGLHEAELVPGLNQVTIEREPALEEYLRYEVPGPLPAGAIARSRTFGLFVDATPGMAELLSVGKVWELTQRPRHRRGAQPYDLVVLDAPATGHVVALLEAPRTFGAVARVGPVARQGASIDELLRDLDLTGVVAVTTPEQMAVSETISLRDTLLDRLGINLAVVVVNRVFSSPFGAEAMAALHATPDDPAVRSARWLHGRAQTHAEQIARLRRQLTRTPSLTLPFLFTDELRRAEVERIAKLLEGSLP